MTQARHRRQTSLTGNRARTGPAARLKQMFQNSMSPRVVARKLDAISRTATRPRVARGSRSAAAALFSAQFFACVFGFLTEAHAQHLLHTTDDVAGVNLLPGDAAVLDMEEVKKDLPCTVTSIKPVLGFDLRFHAGYEISLPLRELAGSGQTLTVMFSVTPNSAKDSPRYFSQKFKVPEIPDDAGGKTLLGGEFDIGEGTYHIRWLMRDRQERVCSSNWDINAALNGRDQEMKMNIRPEDVEASEPEFFKPEPPVSRKSDGDPLKVKVLINYAPQESAAAAMAPLDASALVSILRTIAREPRIMKFSVVAFNMNEQRVVYRGDNLDEIDFPGLGHQLSSLRLGMVDYKQLADRHSPTDFLTRLVQDELVGTPADAVIFAGPKAFLDEPVPPETLKDIGAIGYPLFYMNYMTVPPGGWSDTTPWRDAIGTVVKRLRGFEYTITRPRDLWTAWTDIMSHIVKVKLASTATASSH